MQPKTTDVPPKLAVIVVTRNSADVLPGLLDSLQRLPPPDPWDLIVVDNDSSDRSIARVRESIPAATVLPQSENRGFAAGVNLGASQASGDFLLIVNPDVQWDGDIFTPLLGHLTAHPRAAAVSPRLVYPDGRPQWSIRRFPHHRNIWFSRGSPLAALPFLRRFGTTYTQPDPCEPARVEAVAATCLFVRRAAFEAVCGMDTGYFLYVEDTDLCRRWADAGWEVWVRPDITVTHHWSSRVGERRRLARYHRAGIRRYFGRHHPRRRLANGVLFLVLGLADLVDRWGGRARQRESDRG